MISKPRIGIIIPIIQKIYIKNLISLIFKTNNRKDLLVCVVNDGNHKINNYVNKLRAHNIEIINLKNNSCFAGANNAGWKYLINKFSSIDYLGSINDDTIPNNNWLNELVLCLDKNESVGACGPIMQSGSGYFKKNISNSATWKLNNIEQPMVIENDKITTDEFVSVLGGFCFLAKKNALEQIDFFDERFKNSCEDIDLSLKLLKVGWNMKVCSKSFVYHKCGKSRFKSNTNTNIKFSRQLLAEKWGRDLTKYNLK